MSYLPCLDCLHEFYAIPVLLHQPPKTLSLGPPRHLKKACLFFFFMLDQQRPKAEKTKGVLNLNHADACECIDLDQRPRLWPANSTSTEISSKIISQAWVLCIQIVRL